MERLLPSTINVLVAFYQQPVRVRHGSVPVTSVSYNNDAFQEVFCMQIREDNLDGPEIAEMLREHIRSAHEHSPAENDIPWICTNYGQQRSHSGPFGRNRTCLDVVH